MMNKNNMNNEQQFNAQFNAGEQSIIARFVEYVANQNSHSISDTIFNVETDEEIRSNVLQWLDKKYKAKLGKR
jgi:hypothetical protein